MPLTLMNAVLLVGLASLAYVMAIRIRKTLQRREKLAKAKLTRSTRLLPRSTRVLAVLGSGGHTAEMLALLKDIDASKPKISYVVADDGSARKVADARRVYRVPRARHVGEPFWRAVPRAVGCVVVSVRVLLKARPNVVLTNGPASGALVALVALALNAVWLLNARVVYMESVARVTTLSLSGRVLYPVAHRFVVQWPQLARRYPRAEYHGRYS